MVRKLSLLLLVAFFFVNPGFACAPEDEYQYGAAELRAAIEGDWAVTITPTGGTATEYRLNLKQATSAPSTASARRPTGLIRAAHACGTRTLVAGAAACVDITEMPLTVTLAPGAPAVSGTPTASYRVWSLVFTTGDLDLALGAHRVSAQVKADGTVSSASLSNDATGTATMRRLP